MREDQARGGGGEHSCQRGIGRRQWHLISPGEDAHAKERSLTLDGAGVLVALLGGTLPLKVEEASRSYQQLQGGAKKGQ